MPAHQLSRGAELLAEWRGTRTAKEVCDLLGVDSATYSRFERGIRRPSGEVAYRIEGITRGSVPSTSWYERPARRRAASS